MARKGWYEALANALQKQKQEAVMQLATLEAPDGPRVRSLIHRGFLTASALPSLPLILTTTDIRTPKVAQFAASDAVVEVVYWTHTTQEQFRVRGRASVVPAPGYGGAYPPRRGVVCAALDREGFDWEKKRVETFDGMSGHLKASWCRPVPGTPLVGGEEEMKQWPARLPRLGEAESEEEKRDLERALSNFALLLVEPVEVDYLELGGPLDRRTKFERDWEDERSIEFKETLVVP